MLLMHFGCSHLWHTQGLSAWNQRLRQRQGQICSGLRFLQGLAAIQTWCSVQDAPHPGTQVRGPMDEPVLGCGAIPAAFVAAGDR